MFRVTLEWRNCSGLADYYPLYRKDPDFLNGNPFHRNAVESPVRSLPAIIDNGQFSLQLVGSSVGFLSALWHGFNPNFPRYPPVGYFYTTASDLLLNQGRRSGPGNGCSLLSAGPGLLHRHQ